MSMYAVNQTALEHVPARPPTVRGRPHLRLVPPVARPVRGRSRAVFRRRRLVVLLVAVIVVVTARAVVGWSLAGPEPRAQAPAPGPTHVVEHGDTLWEIGRGLQPRGDIRPLLDRLARERGGRPLRVGERIVLP